MEEKTLVSYCPFCNGDIFITPKIKSKLLNNPEMDFECGHCGAILKCKTDVLKNV